jgi:uncharacterized OB-fold protein
MMKPTSSALPPSTRSRIALPMTDAAAKGRFELQVCRRCATVQYPPREACHRCLSDELVWTLQSGDGELLARTVLHHSFEPYFLERLPWTIGMVKLDSGPTVIAHLPTQAPQPPARVRVSAHIDRSGRAVLIAVAMSEPEVLANDARLQELIGR